MHTAGELMHSYSYAKDTDTNASMYTVIEQWLSTNNYQNTCKQTNKLNVREHLPS